MMTDKNEARDFIIDCWGDELPRKYSIRTWTREINDIDSWISKRNSYFNDYMEASLANFE